MAKRADDHETAIAVVCRSLARLGPDWTVLPRPRFGLERIDAVVVHPREGVCAITVTALRAGEVDRDPEGFLVDPDSGRRADDQPHLRAERIGKDLYDGHYADLDDPSDPSDAVRSILVAPNLDDATARELLGRRGAIDVDVASTVWGAGFDAALEAAVSMRVPIAPHTVPPSPVSPSGLRRLLAGAATGPADSPTRPAPAVIRPAAQSIVAEPTGARLRRLRGPGGTGKTFALTARAAALAAAGRRVLVLSFTTTLEDRLTRLVRARAAETGADARLVTITNFHALCEHTVVNAELVGHQTVWPEGSRWPIAIVDRARQAIEQGFDVRYDAILVDEGQDFSLDWWRMLHQNFLVEGGEMLVTADDTQDLYRVEPWFDEEQMRELGFTEPWVELTGSMRTPVDLVPALDVIGDRPEEITAAPERAELVAPPVPSVRRWVDIDRVADLGREIGREVVRLVRDHPTLAPGDVVFLCDYHHDGLAAVREIERAGIPVHHQFSRDPAGRGIRRRRFDVGSSAVKGATVHGFKGWETGALVMGIGADATSPALAAIAIERVTSPAAGGSAIVTVVNGDRSRRERGAALRWDDDLADAVLPPALDSAASSSPAPAPMPASPVAATDETAGVIEQAEPAPDPAAAPTAVPVPVAASAALAAPVGAVASSAGVAASSLDRPPTTSPTTTPIAPPTPAVAPAPASPGTSMPAPGGRPTPPVPPMPAPPAPTVAVDLDEAPAARSQPPAPPAAAESMAAPVPTAPPSAASEVPAAPTAPPSAASEVPAAPTAPPSAASEVPAAPSASPLASPVPLAPSSPVPPPPAARPVPPPPPASTPVPPPPPGT